ncbi:TRAM domain-containing protein [Candidatus Sumerlaeota bacterium]|nr:TRAM domain-containing protein [Candidatus Sumerlaeota bacterium]
MQKFFRDEIMLIRVFFVLIATWVGYSIGSAGASPEEELNRGLIYTAASFGLSLFFVIFEYSTHIVSSKKILLAALGLLIGMHVANFLYKIFPQNILDPQRALMICYLFFGYMGIVLAVRNADRFDTSKLKFIVSSPQGEMKILDTSVIIDGRIKDLFEQQFIKGSVIVPEFVIHEMQRLADSADPTKRARGRRGLDILETLKNVCAGLQIYDKDVTDVDEVDLKLVALSRRFDGQLVTNDFNLQKVAQVHGVKVMNINELASVLKPPTFIGETLKIKVTKSGREEGQGVGYLEDGTMVVVDDGRNCIGEEVNVDVTSILHTSAGRMIFAKLNDAQPFPERDGNAS